MVGECLSSKISPETVRAAEAEVRTQLREWGKQTAIHYRQKTGEVKDLLLVLARTAESVGERDQRCAGQISEVTNRLEGIASLDDLAEIRASIEKSAADLKTSVERMTAESKTAIDQLQAEVAVYQARLEEAEEAASRDLLTGVRSRLYAESQIERRIAAGTPYCLAIIDINGFKRVNDEHGHLVGDELLKQFASELRSACRSTDVIARWGGDEFILVLDCGLREAGAQMDRLRKCIHWSCRTVAGRGDEGCAGPSGCGDVQGQGCFPRNGNRFGAVKRRATNETRLKALAKKRVRDLRGMFAESSHRRFLL
jgi:diguanylate cyclase (GGDEF)-like protein